MRRLTNPQYRVLAAIDAWHRNHTNKATGLTRALWMGDVLGMISGTEHISFHTLLRHREIILDPLFGYCITRSGEAALAYGREKGYVK